MRIDHVSYAATNRVRRPGLVARLGAVIVVLACAAIGIVGLVLPLIPGLVFLAVAVLVAARVFPSVARRLRGHVAIDRHMTRVDRALELGWRDRMRLGAWLCVKAVVDALASARTFTGRAAAASKVRQRNRQWCGSGFHPMTQSSTKKPTA